MYSGESGNSPQARAPPPGSLIGSPRPHASSETDLGADGLCDEVQNFQNYYVLNSIAARNIHPIRSSGDRRFHRGM
jgi:hypothetical protein